MNELLDVACHNKPVVYRQRHTNSPCSCNWTYWRVSMETLSPPRWKHFREQTPNIKESWSHLVSTRALGVHNEIREARFARLILVVGGFFPKLIVNAHHRCHLQTQRLPAGSPGALWAHTAVGPPSRDQLALWCRERLFLPQEAAKRSVPLSPQIAKGPR